MSKHHYLHSEAFFFAIFLTMLPVVWFFSYQTAHAGYEHLRTYYEWGPHYNTRQLPPSPGRVLQAATNADDITQNEVISGYIEKYPNPDAFEASQYFIGVHKLGLVEIEPDQIPDGLNIDQLVGQYVALGKVGEEQILAPVPPPTDPTLIKSAAAAIDNEKALPQLPNPGTAKGFMHTIELIGEGLFDGMSNMVNPSGAIKRSYNRSIERIAEANQLLLNNDVAATGAVSQATKSIHNLFNNENIDDDTAHQLEESIAGVQVTIENEIAGVPEESENAFNGLRKAVAEGVDLAADELDRSPVTPGVVQGLASLKTIGILQREQADFIYGLESRHKVREAFENFEENGYITKADIKGALDEAAGALYPNKIKEIIEIDKLQALSRFEAIRPDDATLAKLKEFSTTFVPGVTQVPPDLLPFWVASVNLDRIQQTIRPDFISEEALSAMEQRKPNTFAKFKELELRLKPSPDDIAALEQYKTQLREQFPDVEDINAYLPLHMQRIASFHDKFGLKEPEGWVKPQGVNVLPFTGPGGLRDVNAIEEYCKSNNCDNYAPPSGFTLKPAVGVVFGPEDAQNPPIFPGMMIFKPPVITYDIVPQGSAHYVGHNGCDNPTNCLKAFHDIPSEKRAQNFFIFQVPPPGANNKFERPENYEEMTSEERRAWVEEEIRSGRKTPTDFSPVDEQSNPVSGPGAYYNSAGNYVPSGYQPNPFSASAYIPMPGSYSPTPGSQYSTPYNSGPLDQYGQPMPGPGAMYDPNSEPYYPTYSEPVNSDGSWTHPPASTGDYYTPPSDDGSSGDDPPPPNDFGGDSGSQPESGIPDDQAIPGPDNGGPSGDDPNSGGGDEPPPDDDGGGDPPPDDGSGGGDEPGGNPDAPPPIPGD